MADNWRPRHPDPGAGDRAFCAGGDVRAVYEAGLGIGDDPELPAVFFREEYELIRFIHRFPKPYIAIIDGITMGGGAGISVNGGYRIATERTLFAMPETGIGLFPDVGATHFLNHCPGHIGRYLALTGRGLGPRTRAIAVLPPISCRASLAQLVGRYARVVAGGRGGRRSKRRSPRSTATGRTAAGLRRAAIDRCFAGDTIEAVLAALATSRVERRRRRLGGADACRAADEMPTSLKVTLRQLIPGCDIEAALALESG